MRWIDKLAALAAARAGTVLDVGVGEAMALERMAPQANRLVGVEYRDDKLRAAVGRLPTLHGVRADAGMLPVRDGAAELVLCTEVLEHLTRPDDAVAELARATAGTCLVSVPWEPWFRLGNLLRGKNLARGGDDPEHVQHYSRPRLRLALQNRFADVQILTSFPWLIGVAREPRRYPHVQ